MSRLERSARAIRAEIAEYRAAAETPPKMAQRRAALLLRSLKASAVHSESREASESLTSTHEEASTSSQPKPLVFFFPPRPESTGTYTPSLKRRAHIRKTEIAALEEAEANFKPSAASTRFFRVSPAREAALLTPVPTSEAPADTDAQVPDTETPKDESQRAPETARATEEKTSDETVTAEESGKSNKPRKSRKKLWLVATAAALLCGGYVGVAATHTDVVPEGTTVAGVDIGSLSPKQAEVKLSSELGGKTSQKIAVTLSDSGEEILVNPENYDLSLDVEATVDSVSGFSLAPTSVAAHLFGGSEHKPVVHYDKVKLAEELQNIQSRVKDGYVNANIVFDELKPTVVPARDGLGIDRTKATEALTVGAFSANKPATLTLSQTSAPVSDKAAQEAVEKYANPLVKAPFTIEFKGKNYEASPQDLANAASFVPVGNELVLVLDGDSLADIVEREKPEGVVFGQDAQIKIVNHDHVEIVPSTDGVGVEREKLASDIISSLNTNDRHVVATLGVAPAHFTTQDAENMGVTEIVSEIDTPFPTDYYRTLNLARGAELTSGKLIRPGETFVLSEALEPVNASNGFYPSGMIIGGVHKNGMGGGLSQITTNTFNLGYLAGYTDVEHHPHSYYFTRYPMGREATLAIGSFDMRWTNNTPYGAIIDTWVEDGYLHSRLWSTKYWDVEATISEPRNVRGVGWNTSTAPDCVPSYPGQNGFTVTISRTVRHGDEVWTETADVTYQPDHGLRCVKPEPEPSDTPSPDADPSSSGE